MNLVAIQTVAARAQAALAKPHDLPSPCVSVCVMDAQSQLCSGCLRTLGEIAAWARMPDDDKRQVWQAIALRAKAWVEPA
jgi:predicted Fe-S protein YdhL (DUF1289 family)